MRAVGRVAALLLALIFAAGLTACAVSPSGSYSAVRVVKDGIEADAAALAQSGAVVSITFEPDGTGVLRFNAASESFKWVSNTMISPEGDTLDFRFDGETLVLERGDTLIEFQ